MKTIFKNIIVAIITFEAKLVLRKYNPKIVAITGSVGKTSTKDAIYTVLKRETDTRKSQKSFNSEIGVPLTILNCENGWSNPFIWIKNIVEGLLLIILQNNYPKVLVLEVGADRPGDIGRVSSWLKPDVAVFTSMGSTPVHVEFFPDPESLFQEKLELVKALKSTGTLVYVEDDNMSVRTKDYTQAERFSIGFVGGSYYKASHDEIIYDEDGHPSGMRFRVDAEGSSIPVVVNGSIGKQHAYPYLAAIAVAKAFDINMVQITESLSEHVTPPGRMRIIPGIKNSTIIDDTYNASPLALSSALSALGDVQLKDGAKKIAVVGDMLELGKHSAQAHMEAGAQVAEVADVLVTIGVRSRKVAEGALNHGLSEKKIYQFEDSQVAGKFLEGIIDPDDVVMIKGSQSIRTERAVKEVMAHPEDCTKLLVRQDGGWEKR